jgi:hypothetical protein
MKRVTPGTAGTAFAFLLSGWGLLGTSTKALPVEWFQILLRPVKLPCSGHGGWRYLKKN